MFRAFSVIVHIIIGQSDPMCLYPLTFDDDAEHLKCSPVFHIELSRLLPLWLNKQSTHLPTHWGIPCQDKAWKLKKQHRELRDGVINNTKLLHDYRWKFISSRCVWISFTVKRSVEDFDLACSTVAAQLKGILGNSADQMLRPGLLKPGSTKRSFHNLMVDKCHRT